jgi:hypothetical protein
MSIVLNNGEKVIFLFDCEYINDSINHNNCEPLYGYILYYYNNTFEINSITKISKHPRKNNIYIYKTHLNKNIYFDINLRNTKIYLGKNKSPIFPIFNKNIYDTATNITNLYNLPKCTDKPCNQYGGQKSHKIILYSYPQINKICFYGLSLVKNNNQLIISGRFYYGVGTNKKIKYYDTISEFRGYKEPVSQSPQLNLPSVASQLPPTMDQLSALGSEPNVRRPTIVEVNPTYQRSGPIVRDNPTYQRGGPIVRDNPTYQRGGPIVRDNPTYQRGGPPP